MAAAGSVLRGLALSLCLPLAAQAGDHAQFNPLGYSGDGRYFAFEQYGIQDGSGFPYSEIFLIDLDTDSFAGGSPFRARVDEDGAGLGEARQQAIAAASSALVSHEIFTPARIIALNGDGEAGEGLALTYGVPGFGFADIIDEHTLSLEIFKAPTSQQCVDWFGEEPMGYALLRETEGVTTEIHRDTRIPASRNCAITYKFYGVTLPFAAYDNASAVAVLSVWSHGFEGPDRRFIALPVGAR